MLRAILIDNNSLDLDLLERKLLEVSEYKIVGKHKNPYAGLIDVVQLKPEIVFLSVELSNARGLELAEEMMKAMPKIKIIFVAKNEKYALNAFDLQVTDFILKPVTTERLTKTIDKLSAISLDEYNLATSMIRCFKQLEFVKITDSIETLKVKWRTAKAKEIFAYLLHHQNNEVRKDQLVEKFWPDAKEKEAYSRLYTSIYHIRTSIQSANLPIDLINSNVGYELELNDVLVDASVFREKVLENIKITEETLVKHKQNLELYRGDYFEVESYEWAKNKQGRLHFLFVNYSKKIADYYLKVENYNDAIVIYTNLQKKLPYHEDSYFELMKLFYKIDDFNRMEHYYHKLIEVMKEIRKSPRIEIMEWYNKVI